MATPVTMRATRGIPPAVCAMLLLGACRSLDAKVHNLRELHHEDGGTSYSAALMGDFEFGVRRSLRVSAPLGFELDMSSKRPRYVSDPAGACLSNLLQLAELDAQDERALALRLELLCWLAVGDASLLSRERCLMELGPIGRQVGVKGPLEIGEADHVPTVDELTASLTDLVTAANPVLAGDSDETQKRVFAEACAALASLDHDIRSGRRVLRTFAALLSARGATRRAVAPLREAVVEVGWRTASLALTRALADPVPHVRAAAIDAWVTATDNACPEVLAGAFGDPDREVVHRVLRAIATHGLPEVPPDDETELWRESWYANLVRTAVESPDGRITAAACQALGTVSGAGFQSLRFDDWVTWWRAHQEAEAGS